MIAQLQSIISLSDAFKALATRIDDEDLHGPVRVSGLAGSLGSIVPALLCEQNRRQILMITSDEEAAKRRRDDLQLLMGQQHVSLFSYFPHPSAPLDAQSTSSMEDIETLRGLLDNAVRIVVTHIRSSTAAVPAPSSIRRQFIRLETGMEYGLTQLQAELDKLGFVRKQFVEATGDYSLRGGILDVFPFVGENPLRIEFSADAVESLREFDPLSQRSIKELSSATVVPDLLAASAPQSTPSATLLDYLHSETMLVLDRPEILRNTIESNEQREGPGVSWDAFSEIAGMFKQMHVVDQSQGSGEVLNFGGVSQPAINGSIKVLRNHLVDLQQRKVQVLVTCDTAGEQDRLRDLLSEVEPLAEEDERQQHREQHQLDLAAVHFSVDALHEGFVLQNAGVALFTEHQIFNRQKRRGGRGRPKFRGISLKELHELRKGDFVVHADYGVGSFDGLKKISVQGAEQEVVKLLYEEKDTLYVNLNYLAKIQKYASKEGHIPKLTRLGSGEWERLKQRTKKRVKDIARDLIRLYAKRKHTQGFAFHKDTLWQRELEASFVYEDTPDQEKATEDIKKDMEAPFPMDRLVCGDVGFGKTEVAVRAAFKAVMSGKQTAVLVPTTILAQQHYNTFLDRLSKYSTRVDVLSRFKSKKEQAEILERLHGGSTDVVIGTHRLLSKDVRFKDLGLLIIDEEHRFGVAAKEKLRHLKENVDTLTLTATPIPRTLHFSLMGARDLSVIATPPRNRLPVITEIVQFNDDHLRTAILREIHRGGQVFFVHDRINNMVEVVGRLQEIVPGVRIRPAHGQMRSHELEDVMLAFLEKRFDLLVATKIIESGIDMPSVNTIIINRADRFGMAELYQLRGRAGRSNAQAYAYLVVPPVSVLPRETIRRLQAVEEFTELGSGFNLAMRDLEIRGAGNLLGGEQSGFIESMGFEMFTKILEEAVAELKEDEFKGLFGETTVRREKEQAVVDVGVSVRIPDAYIESENERLLVYRKLSAVTNETQLNEIVSELEDRFGKYPGDVKNLLAVVRVRLAATRLGFRKAAISTTGISLEFPPESDTEFFESDGFQSLMTHIAQRGAPTTLRQEGKLLLLKHTIQGKNPVTEAEELLRSLEDAFSVSQVRG